MSKNYLIVGGSHGIGESLIRTLADGDNALHVLSRTKGSLPDTISHYPFDVHNDDYPEIEEPLHGLVYLPGTINLKPFTQLSLDDFKKDIEINYLGAVKVVTHYLKNLQKSDNASIVLISTVAAELGLPFHTSVAGAKAAVEGFAKALAAEMAPKIRVNVVAPSLTDTPLAKELLNTETRKEHAEKRHPLNRIGKPEDISHAISYLLSDQSSWVSGQVFHIDGGFSTLRLL